MGSTLRIAHNVFEKVKVEKDRKERLENYENWQKEKAKKLKALDELNEKLRDFEKIKAIFKQHKEWFGFVRTDYIQRTVRRGRSTKRGLFR